MVHCFYCLGTEQGKFMKAMCGGSTMKMTRLQKEQQVIETMIRLYCKGNKHASGALCEDCQALCEASKTRLAHCRHGEQKTFCGQCKTNCYPPILRENMRAVMRYSGPRIMLYHPIMALRHALHI